MPVSGFLADPVSAAEYPRLAGDLIPNGPLDAAE